ncbi:uncharacterized protein B0I36DRAFT_344618 [Microdochium trichocladiopsis]|uniref:WSC domain-containing protein n=1 Tax=Microdochium trichocladiopsis TaxID=1682393 RepID=A0A9P9BWV5_9PEZI|nr:uncharacterized protein B0I36DRAFT_344618 [Microdochium trichocladiopsis]KAH7040965.1 hypothetical protein B0I36DRAFT_344618 [Microdochium trichocladiopsis]
MLFDTAHILGILLIILNQTSARECDTPLAPEQYVGTPFDHALPRSASSEVTFFKIKDPTGEFLCDSEDARADLSLLNYMSLNKDGERPDPKKLMRAVIAVHGWNRDPWNYHAALLLALAKAEAQDPAKSLGTVAVIAPYFPNGDDKGIGYPWDEDGESVADRAYSPALVWWASAWSAGAVNNYPPETKTVSSFAVLDQIVQYFGNLERFPNMRQIIVAGHSLGGQTVQRYVAVGKTRQELGVTVPVDYWIGDPNSFVWLNETRPFPVDACSDFDNYREGFTGYEAYGAEHTGQPMNYNLELVSQGSEAIIKNFQDKPVHWARATRDLGDHPDDGCGPYTQGKDRNERFFAFIRQFPPSCTSQSAEACDTVDFVDASHDAPALFADESGLARLFHDNFYGRGQYAPDYGHPRQMGFDDPRPDGGRLGEPLLGADEGVYAGQMKHRGCWSDVDRAQTERTLSELVYDGPENTRAFCTATCAESWFKIAAVSGSRCYCGNQLDRQAVEVPPSSCTTKCPGDAAQVCGGDTRLNVFGQDAFV